MSYFVLIHLDSDMPAFKLLSEEQVLYLNEYSVPGIFSSYEYVWEVPIEFFYTVEKEVLHALIEAIKDAAFTEGTDAALY